MKHGVRLDPGLNQEKKKKQQPYKGRYRAN